MSESPTGLAFHLFPVDLAVTFAVAQIDLLHFGEDRFLIDPENFGQEFPHRLTSERETLDLLFQLKDLRVDTGLEVGGFPLGVSSGGDRVRGAFQLVQLPKDIHGSLLDPGLGGEIILLSWPASTDRYGWIGLDVI